MNRPRLRTTWTNNDAKSREAATSRRADIFTMNQDHPQPSPVEYESGDPDSWAETPTGNQLVYDGYEGGEGGSEARNEVNYPEFKPETFNHKDSDKWHGPGKYDNAKVSAATNAVKKASLAKKLAIATLRTSSESLITQQASDFMNLPDPVLVESLRRVNKASFQALPEEARFKRSMACCKLATKVLSQYEPNEAAVERLARAFMMADDPVLKGILATLAEIEASAVVASEDDEEEAEETTSSTQVQSSEEEEACDDTETASTEQTSAVEISMEDDMEEDDSETAACDLDPASMDMLNQMITEDSVEVPAPSGSLADLFSGAPAPAAPAPAMVPVASSGVEISFGGDDDDEGVHTASGADPDLDVLFNDNEEVMAQRDIVAAQREQSARETNYAGVGRVASAGAKRLGNVQQSAAKNGDNLENLWERPTA